MLGRIRGIALLAALVGAFAQATRAAQNGSGARAANGMMPKQLYNSSWPPSALVRPMAGSCRSLQWLGRNEMNEVANRIQSSMKRIRFPIARHALALLNKL